jgi:hypothetical protein
MIEEDKDHFVNQRRGDTNFIVIQKGEDKERTFKAKTVRDAGLNIDDISGSHPASIPRFNRPPIDYDSYDGCHPGSLVKFSFYIFFFEFTFCN